ncbi:hypothetical protein AsAng_0007750 [Aureispira anguillae]|uniref:Uncharacterized protein n=1 Tax=Aureispira anguillae TaxID=2864201 RepID=A0A915YBL3_9BACT|nr:hypothetical protein AsAng_0007750 [Aureispira anguillae]
MILYSFKLYFFYQIRKKAHNIFLHFYQVFISTSFQTKTIVQLQKKA